MMRCPSCGSEFPAVRGRVVPLDADIVVHRRAGMLEPGRLCDDGWHDRRKDACTRCGMYGKGCTDDVCQLNPAPVTNYCGFHAIAGTEAESKNCADCVSACVFCGKPTENKGDTACDRCHEMALARGAREDHAPCVWRTWTTEGFGTPGCRTTSSGTQWHAALVAQMRHCPDCGAPLQVEKS